MTSTSAAVAAVRTILVVDDDLWLREIAARALRTAGYEVLEACDGQAALTVSANHPGAIDLVCADAVMPGMTGAEVVDSLRRVRPAIKAVFMSGYRGEDLGSWGVDASCETFIQKPFTAANLLRSVGERLAAAEDAADGPAFMDPLDELIASPARLRAVRETDLLDAPREERFDRLTRLAARFLHAPTAFLALLDEDRDFYLSTDGMSETVASSRSLQGRTLCHYALRAAAPLVVGDVASDPVFGRVPTVVRFGVGAYLGIPLIVDGQTIGTLCVIDSVPRTWSPEEVRVLGDLGAMALDEIALRSATRLRSEAHVRLERANLQLHLAKNTAEAATRAKSEFLAHMSHDLRTPLNAIIGFANLLRRNATGTMSAREVLFAERIGSNGDYLLAVVDGILDLSKVEQGDLTLRLTRLQVADLVRSICDDLAENAAAAGVTLAMVVDGLQHPGQSPALLHTDGTKVRQILMNLVGNALKFTSAGGSVRVTLACDASSAAPLRVDVSDNGIGIAPEAQARVFDAFEQAEYDTNARFGGSGLGLRISRALCDALGYGLTLQSEVGVGSTFSVSFVR